MEDRLRKTTDKSSSLALMGILGKNLQKDETTNNRLTEPLAPRDSVLSYHAPVFYTEKPAPLESMLKVIEPTQKNPTATMGFFKKLFFAWVNPIFDKGKEVVLQPSDLYKVGTKAADMKKSFAEAKSTFKEEEVHPLDVAYKVIKPNYQLGICLFVLGAVAQMIGPILFNFYFQRISKARMNEHNLLIPFFIVGLIAIDLFVRGILMNQASFHLASGRLSVLIRQQIFEKLAKMSIVHQQNLVLSTLTTLLTIDVDHLGSGLTILPNFIGAGVILTCSFFFLTSSGHMIWILVLLVIMVFFIFYKLHQQTKINRMKLLKCTDAVSKLVKDFVLEITNVKINRVEEVFYNRLVKVKELEAGTYKKYLRWSIMASVLNYIFPTIFGLSFFGLSIWFMPKNSQPSLAETYIVLTVLSVMRTPLTMINDGFNKYPEYETSKSRIIGFLSLVVEKNDPLPVDESVEPGHIEMKKATFGLPPINFKNQQVEGAVENLFPDHLKVNDILKDISIRIEKGSKTAIVGPDNSGKTFFLLSILNETHLRNGKISSKGETVYIPRAGCFTEDSIYQNIVCGRPLDREKYDEIVEKCHLRECIDTLEGKEHFILRDNGSNLARSVKKKVMLARMLYGDYDIYLIDSYLDDIDLDFRKYVVAKIIQDHLKDKTVLVVTERMDVCRLLDNIVVFNEGKIEQEGKFKTLASQSDGLFCSLIGTAEDDEDDLEEVKRSHKIQKEIDTKKTQEEQNDGEKEVSSLSSEDESQELENDVQNKLINIVQAERVADSNPYVRERAKRNWKSIMNTFFLNSGKCLAITYLFLIALTQIFTYAFIWFIAQWKAKAFHIGPISYLYYYGGITVAAFLTLVLTNMLFISLFRRVSFKFFLNIIRSLISRDLEWIKKTPASKIFNTFLTDYNEVDQFMAPLIHGFLQVFIRLNVGFIIILYKNYLFGATLILVHIFIIKILVDFLSTDRSIKQIMVKNRSHMLSMVRDASGGLLHYRNSGVFGYLENNFYTVQDIFQNAKSTDGNMCLRWLSARIFTLTIFYPVLVLLDGLLKIVMGVEPNYTLHSIQFAVALDITYSSMSFVASFSKNEVYLSDIERIVELTSTSAKRDDLIRKNIFHNDKESSDIVGSKAFDGAIEFDKVTYKYGGVLDFALSNASFEVQPKEKVALIGLPNSGRHTVLNLLTGLADHKKIMNGEIRVGGRVMNNRMIEHLGSEVYYLNSRFALFQGDLRTNIDPIRRHTDEEIVQLFAYLGLWTLLDMDSKKGEVRRTTSLIQGATMLINDSDLKSELKVKSANCSIYSSDSINDLARIELHSIEKKEEKSNANKGDNDQSFQAKSIKHSEKSTPTQRSVVSERVIDTEVDDWLETKSQGHRKRKNEDAQLEGKKEGFTPYEDKAEINLREGKKKPTSKLAQVATLIKFLKQTKKEFLDEVKEGKLPEAEFHPLTESIKAEDNETEINQDESQKAKVSQDKPSFFNIVGGKLKMSLMKINQEKSMKGSQTQKSKSRKSVKDMDLNELTQLQNLFSFQKHAMRIANTSNLWEEEKHKVDLAQSLTSSNVKNLGLQTLPMINELINTGKIPAYLSKDSWVQEMKGLDIEKCKEMLYTVVGRSGHSFSQLEMKLIQIGKAILMRPKVLLVDSHFFNVEEIFEILYYSLIITNLKESTVICALDSYDMLDHFDRIVVMDKGSVLESGLTSDLLRPAQFSETMRLVQDRASQDKQYQMEIEK